MIRCILDLFRRPCLNRRLGRRGPSPWRGERGYKYRMRAVDDFLRWEAE
jgi:hypothetical protein